MATYDVRHVFLLLFFEHVIHVTRGADLVIRIPGGGQPKDGFYRLDYRLVLAAKMYGISSIFVNNQCVQQKFHCPHLLQQKTVS